MDTAIGPLPVCTPIALRVCIFDVSVGLSACSVTLVKLMLL